MGRRPDGGPSVPEEVEVVVFCEHAQLEQVRQTGSFPKLATAPHPPLQLFAEGFDGAAPQGSAFLCPVLIVDMFSMRSEVFHFPGNSLSDFRGTSGLGLGFEVLLLRRPGDRRGLLIRPYGPCLGAMCTL